jgi:predicted enzyme related to lactoylglutathione lyase
MQNFNGEVRVVFYTNKFEKVMSFYTDILGLEIFKEFDHGKFQRGIVFKVNSTLIEFLETEKEPLNNTDSYLYIEHTNIGQYYNDVIDKVEIVSKLESFPWGHTSFITKDPEGNKLKFFSQK